MKYQGPIRVKGKQIIVDAFKACGQEFFIKGKLYRTAKAKEEWDIDIDNPEAVIHELISQSINADIFTFMQRLPQTKPIFGYRMELDNVAAIPISTYEHWWTKQITQEARNKVRKAIKKGVNIRAIEYNDDLVGRIKEIYREAPLRRGVPFTHYKKSFDETKRANATFLERADFIGAYFGDELIGFVKLVHTGGYTRVMGILGKQAHKEKAPMNALIAKAVDICAEKNISFLSYGKMIYGSKGFDSLARFKQENGFIMYTLPRYFIPLSLKGKTILALNLHKNFREILPRKLVTWLIKTRNFINKKKYSLASKNKHSHFDANDKI
jgi:hypothetical protein